MASSTNLFEKPREVQADRDMKFNLITTYNKLLDSLITHKDNGQFDLGVVCDTLLDLLRYQNNQCLDPKAVIKDYA